MHKRSGPAKKGELAIYEPVREVIAGSWARDRGITALIVEITAQQGRRPTGGTWTRPDLVGVEVRTFDYVPGKRLEVITFEVKAANAIDVRAVYEALAHRAAATRSYLILHVPVDEAGRWEASVARVAEAARHQGIGVLTVGDPGDYQTWRQREEAIRVEPEPERLNEFIATQLSPKTRALISRSLR
ncbi:MAG: hypothetical protein AUI14_00070 [Actinobacteria bacterium 13_2_20CM_2_71_6]|nr:MAG: hypothetical protein AUI14_00070 [Actinobacteria bacterium 13_2_20CM_2_71_6]